MLGPPKRVRVRQQWGLVGCSDARAKKDNQPVSVVALSLQRPVKDHEHHGIKIKGVATYNYLFIHSTTHQKPHKFR